MDIYLYEFQEQVRKRTFIRFREIRLHEILKTKTFKKNKRIFVVHSNVE